MYLQSTSTSRPPEASLNLQSARSGPVGFVVAAFSPLQAVLLQTPALIAYNCGSTLVFCTFKRHESFPDLL